MIESYLAPILATGLLTSELWEGVTRDPHALMWLGLMQVAFILAAWGAASLLVPRREMNSFGQFENREGGGLGRAILLYLGYLALAALCVLALRWSLPSRHALVTLFAHSGQLGLKWSAIFAVTALVLAVLKLGLPMAIYRVRLARAVGLLLLIALLLAGAGWGLDVVLGRPAARNLAVVQNYLARRSDLAAQPVSKTEQEVLFTAGEAAASDPAKSLTERKQAVLGLYKQLEAIRTRLPEGDKAALAAYGQKKLRYEALLKQIKAEIAARPEAAE